MNSKDAAAVKAAKRGTKPKTTSDFSSEASGKISDQLDQVTDSFAESIKTRIVVGGIQKALKDISEGNLGEAGTAAIASLDSFIEDIEVRSKQLGDLKSVPPKLGGSGGRNQPICVSSELETMEIPSQLLPSLGDYP